MEEWEMITGIAYYTHANGVMCGAPIVGRCAGDLEREADRLGATTYRDQYGDLVIKLRGQWVTL